MPLPSSALRLCHVIRAFSGLLLMTLPMIHLHHWWTTSVDALLLATGVPLRLLPDGYTLSAAQRTAGALASGILVLAMMWSLVQARAAFQQFLSGQLFGERTIAAIHRFALGILLTTLIAIVEPLWMSTLLTRHLPAAQRHTVFHLGSGHLFMLIVAALFWTLTYIMKRGAELAAENEQFV